MLVIQIDRVHAKALERRVAGGADVLRPAVHSPEAAVGTAHVPELHRQDHLRSEEHTSELQSPCNLVCRLLLEKKKKKIRRSTNTVKATELTYAVLHDTILAIAKWSYRA